MKFWTAIYKHASSFRADASTQERALEKLNNRTGPGSCVITDEDVEFVERDETYEPEPVIDRILTMQIGTPAHEEADGPRGVS